MDNALAYVVAVLARAVDVVRRDPLAKTLAWAFVLFAGLSLAAVVLTFGVVPTVKGLSVVAIIVGGLSFAFGEGSTMAKGAVAFALGMGVGGACVLFS